MVRRQSLSYNINRHNRARRSADMESEEEISQQDVQQTEEQQQQLQDRVDRRRRRMTIQSTAISNEHDIYALVELWNVLWKETTSISLCRTCNSIGLGDSRRQQHKNTSSRQVNKVCRKCVKEKEKWSAENDMQPLEVPEIFRRITQQEVNCLRQINPVLPIVDKRDHFRGSIMNLSNPMQSVAKKLPIASRYIKIDKISPHGEEKTMLVKTDTIYECLRFLKANNCFYKDIEFNDEEEEVVHQNIDDQQGEDDEDDVAAQKIMNEIEVLYNSSMELASTKHANEIKENLRKF